ncbi:MAG: ATP-dependent 6-phosphofructokinase, partial [Treponema sp.]|nr:ATP-dependent 6-phosphofructokinase [Treponema sp.]
MTESFDFTVEELGKRNIKSPIVMSTEAGDGVANYVDDNKFVRLETGVSLGAQKEVKRSQILECAGPREMLYFTPAHVHAGIVSCGGLCPGINDVIRAIVRCLWYRYG